MPRQVWEKSLRELLTHISNSPNHPFMYDLVFDKTISPYSRYRPDVQLRRSGWNGLILIEVDEHQHKSGYYNENGRLCDLYQAAGTVPTYVIRINFDGYNAKEPVDPVTRAVDLINCICGLMIMPAAGGLHITKLYYDGYTDVYEWETLVKVENDNQGRDLTPERIDMEGEFLTFNIIRDLTIPLPKKLYNQTRP